MNKAAQLMRLKKYLIYSSHIPPEQQLIERGSISMRERGEEEIIAYINLPHNQELTL